MSDLIVHGQTEFEVQITKQRSLVVSFTLMYYINEIDIQPGLKIDINISYSPSPSHIHSTYQNFSKDQEFNHIELESVITSQTNNSSISI